MSSLSLTYDLELRIVPVSVTYNLELHITTIPLPEEAQGLVGPVIHETWEQHFVNNGWNTPQDQIDAGYPYYLQPAANHGSFQKVIDLEAVVDGKIDVVLNSEVLAGSPSMHVLIEVSLDGEEWIPFEESLEVYATQYQYIRITVNIESDEENKGLIVLHSIRYRISMVEIFDRGRLEASEEDVDGTWVSFNKDFIDVQSVNLTVHSTDYAVPVLIFEDEVEPEGFKVKVFDVNGNRTSRTVSWDAQGV